MLYNLLFHSICFSSAGDLARDAAAVRLFIKEGHRIALAQSYAKNMGLYGEYKTKYIKSNTRIAKI